MTSHKIVCYYGSWSVYRPGNGKFDISHIDPGLCSHLVYAFVGLNEDASIRVLDPWNDLPDNGGKDGFNRFNKLRERNGQLRTMVAIGGWNEGSVKYSNVASSDTLRAKFVENAVAFVKKYGFNGLDLDWEYPCQRGGSPADKGNFVRLLRQLRESFEREGLILSAAVACAEASASKSYDVAGLASCLDFVNVMCYDLHGAWDKKTGINAPLYPGPWETGDQRKFNVDSCIKYWLSEGAPADKLVLGVPFYGRGFTLADPSLSGIGAKAYSGSEPGPYTREAGLLGYNEILEKLRLGGWQSHYCTEQRVPYAVGGNQWLGYDCERSLKEKTNFIKEHKLGGAMVWSIETDDFLGHNGRKYPLLNVLNEELS